MRHSQNKAVFKCHTALLLGPLERRLRLAKEKVRRNEVMEKIIHEIFTEVSSGKDFVETISGWDRVIEKIIDNLIHDKNSEIQMFADKNSDLKRAIHKLHNALKHPRGTHLVEAFDLPREDPIITEIEETSNRSYQKKKITEIGETSNRSYQENKIPMDLDFLHSLDPKMKSCLYSLILFPEKTELKKRLVIYWWIGLGLIEPFTGDTSRTEQCEFFFSKLVGMGVLIPICRAHSKAIDQFILEPTIRKLLISACDFFRPEKSDDGTWHLYDGDNTKILLNLDIRYLNSEEISKYIHYFGVVQLGVWQCTKTEFMNEVEETNSNPVIVVDETDFLNKLGENVTYLSLRGIFGIEKLQESIGKLENLMILDLNACRHLEKLPQKPRSISKQKLIRWALPQVSWFKKLMVLDISGCYLLDHHMPKWICEIANLEVLKGFVVGSVGNKNRSCQLRDLSKLNKLRKLSIRIANSVPVDLSVLQPLDRLLVLTIMWEGNTRNNHIPASSLPDNIEKLDIRCYPQYEASELLNPAKLKNLKRLYIRGGKLTKIPCEDNWEVEILRLRFLQKLEQPTWEELKRSFKNLRYVEFVGCPKPVNFPNDGTSWSQESDEPFQRDNAGETSNES